MTDNLDRLHATLDNFYGATSAGKTYAMAMIAAQALLVDEGKVVVILPTLDDATPARFTGFLHRAWLDLGEDLRDFPNDRLQYSTFSAAPSPSEDLVFVAEKPELFTPVSYNPQFR